MSLFSERLKSVIEQSNVPVGTLAELSGISASLLYKYQSGSRLPDSVETLERLLSAAACALPQRLDLIQTYQIERIGTSRYAAFHALKGMLADLTSVDVQVPDRLTWQDTALPTTITGTGNVNAAVYAVISREVVRKDGRLDLLIPPQYGYCFDCLTQTLRGCHPSFHGVRHMFCLRATATDEAVLYNMEAIRMVLPRMLSMERYDPWYSYLQEPDNGIAPFPYMILASTEVLLLSGDFQDAVYLQDRDVSRLYQRRTDALLRHFTPIMHASAGTVEDYFTVYRNIISGLKKPPRPIVLSSAPCILPCISLETVARYLPREQLEKESIRRVTDTFYQQSGENGYTTFFTHDGLMRMLETGKISDMQGEEIPQFSKAELLDALEELVRRAKAGAITPHLFKENIFRGNFQISMALYDTKLLTVCELPQHRSVFFDTTEATLSRVLRSYADAALLLEDVHSAEETIRSLERTIRRCRGEWGL